MARPIKKRLPVDWNSLPVLLLPSEVGKIFRTDDRAIKRYINQGRMKATYVFGKYLIEKDEVIAFIERESAREDCEK